jgi:hypothetical protein
VASSHPPRGPPWVERVPRRWAETGDGWRSGGGSGRIHPNGPRAGCCRPGRPILSIAARLRCTQASMVTRAWQHVARPPGARRPRPYSAILCIRYFVWSMWSMGGPSGGPRRAAGDNVASMLARCCRRGAPTPRTWHRRPCFAGNTGVLFVQNMQSMQRMAGHRTGLRCRSARRQLCLLETIDERSARPESAACASTPPYSAPKSPAEYAVYGRPGGPGPPSGRASETGAAPVGGRGRWWEVATSQDRRAGRRSLRRREVRPPRT